MADVQATLDELAALVEGAKSMPLSSSCVLNRPDVLALVVEIRQQLPSEITVASGILRDREDVIADGRQEADRIIAAAQQERTRLVAKTEVAQEATRQAEAILDEAREAARVMRVEVEDYVDAKLANFEVVLHKTLAAVERGREKLRGRHELEALRAVEHEAAEPLPG